MNTFIIARGLLRTDLLAVRKAATDYLSLTQFFVFTVCLLLVPDHSLNAQTGSANRAYRLDAGDIISISVYEEADLSFGAIRVTETGTLNYPMLGELDLMGLTVRDLETKIRTELVEGEFLVNPEITVSIVQYRPFYIDGEVNNPGGFPYEPGLTVRKAVSLAGGFTDRASRSNISIISGEVEEGEDREVNLEAMVRPGDVVTVAQRFF